MGLTMSCLPRVEHGVRPFARPGFWAKSAHPAVEEIPVGLRRRFLRRRGFMCAGFGSWKKENHPAIVGQQTLGVSLLLRLNKRWQLLAIGTRPHKGVANGG